MCGAEHARALSVCFHVGFAARYSVRRKAAEAAERGHTCCVPRKNGVCCNGVCATWLGRATGVSTMIARERVDRVDRQTSFSFSLAARRFTADRPTAFIVDVGSSLQLLSAASAGLEVSATEESVETLGKAESSDRYDETYSASVMQRTFLGNVMSFILICVRISSAST